MKTFTADMTQPDPQKKPDDQLIDPKEEARLEEVSRFLSWGNGTLAPDPNDIGMYGGIRL